MAQPERVADLVTDDLRDLGRGAAAIDLRALQAAARAADQPLTFVFSRKALEHCNPRSLEHHARAGCGSQRRDVDLSAQGRGIRTRIAREELQLVQRRGPAKLSGTHEMIECRLDVARLTNAPGSTNRKKRRGFTAALRDCIAQGRDRLVHRHRHTLADQQPLAERRERGSVAHPSLLFRTAATVGCDPARFSSQRRPAPICAALFCRD